MSRATGAARARSAHRGARRGPLRWGRRLLLVPAAALVLVGGPALAIDQPSSSTPQPAVQQEAVSPGAQPVGAGFANQVGVNSADLVGVKWSGDPDAQFTVEARQAGGDWKTVQNVGVADTGADSGTPDARKIASRAQVATDPVAVDGASEVRVTVQSGTVSNVTVSAVNEDPVSAPSGSAGALGSVLPRIDGPARYAYAIALLALAALLAAIALGWTPRRPRRKTLRNVALMALGVLVLAGCLPPAPNIPNGSVQPPIITRAQWGAAPFDATNCGTPSYAPSLLFAVVHHTDSPNTDSAGFGAARVRGIQAYHMATLGYCDIAYNFLIDRYGQIFEGRDGGIDKPVIAAHAGGFNTNSVGIALIGTFGSTRPPQAQWNSLVHLLRWRLSVGRVNPAAPFTTTVGAFDGARYPAGTMSFGNAILMHRDVDLTDCPGNTFYSQLADLRNQVQSGIVIPPLPPSTTAATTTTTTTTMPATTTTT